MTPQHECTHAQPGGHSLDDEHVGRPAQKKFSQQKQHPSVVTVQKQQAEPSQFGAVRHMPHPPASMQDVDGGESALATDAVIIDAAPRPAAPMPARFSRRLLETRSSAIAIRRSSIRG